MVHYDVIVVGGGISGLMSALTLSKHGKKVLVLEKRRIVGGNCNSYMVDGFWVDTGVHVLTHLQTGPLRRLMDKYFDYIPILLDHGTYYVRTPQGLIKLPSNLKEFATFDVIPKKDRLLLSQYITKVLTQTALGVDLSTKSVYETIPKGLSQDSLDLSDALCYSLSGKSMEETSIHRALTGSALMRDSVRDDFGEDKDIAKSYLTLITNHLNTIQLKERLSNLIATNNIGHSQAYPRKGIRAFLNSVLHSMPDSVDIKTSTKVTKILTNEDNVNAVLTPYEEYEAEVIVYTGFAKKLPFMMDNLPQSYINELSQIVQTRSMTVWLGLDTKLSEFDYVGSEIWFKPKAYWAMPISNFNAELAPPGKQLVGFTSIMDDSIPFSEDKKRLFETILKALPGIEDHIEMIHYQVTIPEKASVTINGNFADIRTPVKNLYIAGTDADKRSMGITRAGYSVLELLKVMREDGHID